jgi:hypothetical protein
MRRQPHTRLQRPFELFHAGVAKRRSQDVRSSKSHRKHYGVPSFHFSKILFLNWNIDFAAGKDSVI